MGEAFNRVRIETGEKITDVLPLLGGYGSVYVVYDAAVEAFAMPLCEALHPASRLRLCGGEREKSLDSLERLWSWLMENEAGRDAFLLIVGGGATSDASAFAASVYKRGIGFAIIPTTLLAQVDAAIGGKNAINFGRVKNVLGVVRQPEFTFICPEPLATLPENEFLCGLAELLKTQIISGKGYEETVSLCARGGAVASKVAALEDRILEAARFKAGIVEADPYDNGGRRVLNLGHTFGHAVEARAGIGHGEAVAIGIIMSARLAEKLGLAAKGLSDRLAGDFAAVGLPVESPVLPATASTKRHWPHSRAAARSCSRPAARYASSFRSVSAG